MTDMTRLLAVDDVPLNLTMIEMMLNRTGTIETVTAPNGREALDLLAGPSRFDVILLDLEMPVLDGFATLQRLKEDERLRKIPVIVVTANKEEVVRTLELGANDFLAKPFNPEELKLRVMNQVSIKRYHDLMENMTHVLEDEVARKTEELQRSLAFAKETEYEISLRLGKASEFRDVETGMHIVRMSQISRVLAELAGLPAVECDLVRYAAPLHDVGKIGIPDRILLKPGKLTPEEFDIMKMHSTIGAKMLDGAERYPVIAAGRVIALEHHERWGGGGYPQGLRGEEIHIHGRIVAIADNFDALMSSRPYKAAFPLEKTLAIMDEGEGSFFDPTLYRLFRDNLDHFVRIREQFQDDAPEAPAILQLAEMVA